MCEYNNTYKDFTYSELTYNINNCYITNMFFYL
jgi:hypothetical protein